jgi:hypothetical protein
VERRLAELVPWLSVERQAAVLALADRLAGE